MTCIAAFAKDGVVYMAADSAATDNESFDQVTLKHPKVFERFSMLFGVSGNLRQQNIVRYFEPEFAWLRCEDPVAHLVRSIVPALEKAFDAAHLMADKRLPGRMLVGTQGRIFEIDDTFGVSEFDVPFAAIGSGAPYALGAMHAMWTNRVADPEMVVLKAVESAIRFNAACRGPITLEVK